MMALHRLLLNLAFGGNNCADFARPRWFLNNLSTIIFIFMFIGEKEYITNLLSVLYFIHIFGKKHEKMPEKEIHLSFLRSFLGFLICPLCILTLADVDWATKLVV